MPSSVRPLGLYLHFPWCLQKCPYCDFNSQPLSSSWDEARFISALLHDLDSDLQCYAPNQPLISLYFGGGTPSLLSPTALSQVINGVKARIAVAEEMEVTLEANPGTFTLDRIEQWLEAGINRLSLGVQSFDEAELRYLGRHYTVDTVDRALEACRAHPSLRLNLDLIYGLSNQTIEQMSRNLERALSFDPGHLSCYQLSIEPETPFAQQAHHLPDESTEMTWLERQAELMKQHGYRNYEVSAWCREGEEGVHNLNYWRFGDYLGVGPGAHGKITQSNRVTRTLKERDPIRYQEMVEKWLRQRSDTLSSPLRTEHPIPQDALRIEYLMNVLRLDEGFTASEFQQKTGESTLSIATPLQRAEAAQLLIRKGERYLPTSRGRTLLDEWLLWFDE